MPPAAPRQAHQRAQLQAGAAPRRLTRRPSPPDTPPLAALLAALHAAAPRRLTRRRPSPSARARPRSSRHHTPAAALPCRAPRPPPPPRPPHLAPLPQYTKQANAPFFRELRAALAAFGAALRAPGLAPLNTALFALIKEESGVSAASLDHAPLQAATAAALAAIDDVVAASGAAAAAGEDDACSRDAFASSDGPPLPPLVDDRFFERNERRGLVRRHLLAVEYAEVEAAAAELMAAVRADLPEGKEVKYAAGRRRSPSPDHGPSLGLAHGRFSRSRASHSPGSGPCLALTRYDVVNNAVYFKKPERKGRDQEVAKAAKASVEAAEAQALAKAEALATLLGRTEAVEAEAAQAKAQGATARATKAAAAKAAKAAKVAAALKEPYEPKDRHGKRLSKGLVSGRVDAANARYRAACDALELGVRDRLEAPPPLASPSP